MDASRGAPKEWQWDHRLQEAQEALLRHQEQQVQEQQRDPRQRNASFRWSRGTYRRVGEAVNAPKKKRPNADKSLGSGSTSPHNSSASVLTANTSDLEEALDHAEMVSGEPIHTIEQLKVSLDNALMASSSREYPGEGAQPPQ